MGGVEPRAQRAEGFIRTTGEGFAHHLLGLDNKAAQVVEEIFRSMGGCGLVVFHKKETKEMNKDDKAGTGSPAGRPESGSDPAAAEKRNEEEHEKDHEPDLGDRRGRAGDDAKAENASDDGDDEKCNGVAEHGRTGLSR
jgi:hypothetical protein